MRSAVSTLSLAMGLSLLNVVSNSFADECIAKLLLEMPLAELRSRTTFKRLNPIANDSVLTALRISYYSYDTI